MSDKGSVPLEIRAWSRHCLETPNEHFAGLPACPYAQAAWERGEVSVIITDRIGRVSEIKRELPPQGRQTYVIAWTAPEQMSAEQFDDWIAQQNEEPDGIWLMGAHPDAKDDDRIPALPDIYCDEEYAIILMQRLSVVAQASAALGGTRYYDGYSSDEIAEIGARNG